MKIDFDQKLKNFRDETIKETPQKNSDDLTLKTVCINALLANIPNERIEGKEKLERYEFALKLKNGGTIEITVEQAAKLKDLVGKVYNTVISGQTWQMLESIKEIKV